ncbi:MAG: MBL fold metallo-hydrolase [Leptospiraceae bacterium]|nr:MBL fold metallo-hydrolase [Leptospiraceae bacterium]
MFRVTFLGHQGWSVETDDFHLLIDPIVTPYFRNIDFARSWVYPPRAIDLQGSGSVNAIYLSHDHEDHFHIESLHHFDRSTVIYLCGNMSGAAERILREMGFAAVQRLFAMQSIALGKQMTMTLYPPPPSPTEHWVLQPYIEGAHPRESLYNPVDCGISPQFLSMLRKRKIRRMGLTCLANNTQHLPTPYHPTRLLPDRRSAFSNFMPASVLNCHFGFNELPLMDILTIVGRGFMDELNPFGVYKEQSQQQLAAILQQYSYGESLIHGAEPGDVFESRGGKMILTDTRSPLVVGSPEADAKMAEAEQKDLDFDPLSYEYTPATGQLQISDSEIETLELHLAKLALKIACHRMGMELISTNLSAQARPFQEARLLLVLKNGQSSLYYEYWPSFTEFRRVPAAPAHLLELPGLYPHGYECWAADLLALFESDLSIYQIIAFKNRVWSPQNGMHGNYNFMNVLNDLFAPECAPDITYRLYRKAYDRCSQNNRNSGGRNQI